ncbi:MAG: hypothetical protein MPK30_09770 [Gammaproteobacteria bacterium]|nr:hypothetical protein [Gammaproteobacteria bacterium]
MMIFEQIGVASAITVAVVLTVPFILPDQIAPEFTRELSVYLIPISVAITVLIIHFQRKYDVVDKRCRLKRFLSMRLHNFHEKGTPTFDLLNNLLDDFQSMHDRVLDLYGPETSIAYLDRIRYWRSLLENENEKIRPDYQSLAANLTSDLKDLVDRI